MAGEMFSRYELKYLIPFHVYEELAEILKRRMVYDRYGDAEGKYNIISLYFDSLDKKIYYETRNKSKYRQKLRLRIYNEAALEDYAYFEIKKKYKNRVNKRRTGIKLAHAYEYLENGLVDGLDVSNRQIFHEVDSFRSLYNLVPENIVSYDRQAFVGVDDTDLRVTFDYHLRCRKQDLRIETGPDGHFFVEKEMVVLEVKVDHSVPLWLSRVLSELGCRKGSVSKFCTSVDLLDAEFVEEGEVGWRVY